MNKRDFKKLPVGTWVEVMWSDTPSTVGVLLKFNNFKCNAGQREVLFLQDDIGCPGITDICADQVRFAHGHVSDIGRPVRASSIDDLIDVKGRLCKQIVALESDTIAFEAE